MNMALSLTGSKCYNVLVKNFQPRGGSRLEFFRAAGLRSNGENPMEPVRNRLRGTGCVSACVLSLIIISTSHATASGRDDPITGKSRPIDLIPVVNGEFVHNVGELQMNVTNWGIMGSMPMSNYPMGDFPSAQYPASSGIEYLYAAGLWVGALRNGIPCVSTAYPEDEFRAPMDAVSTIYSSFAGDFRGNHLPLQADDDLDGKIDEDPLNGLDDDGDGRIDEDFAAIGTQMFACEYNDEQRVSRLLWPEHTPMYISIRQESYQWGEETLNDFVGVRYTVTNSGLDYLSDIYIGIYADLDAGPRDRGAYYMDDLIGFWEGRRCAPKGTAQYPVTIRVAYVHDADGDEGRTTGYFGIALLGHTQSIDGSYAPPFPSVSLVSFRVFRGFQPFMSGGDPTNDFERYQVISTFQLSPDTEVAGDYRILLSTGPFNNLQHGMSVDVSVAFVAGDDFDDMLDNAAIAQLVYNGVWHDLDGDPQTGVSRRETPMPGPLKDFDPDYCDGIEEKLNAARGETIWANNDCVEELMDYRDRLCYKPLGADLNYYATGLGGREHNLHWITGGAPPTPNMRVVPGDHSVTVFWDNLSETAADIVTGLIDFEGYQIYRADDWHRPLGSSEANGPGSDLWSLMEIRDLVNGIKPDIDFKLPFESGGWEYSPLQDLPGLQTLITAFEQILIHAPMDALPCPPGLTEETCDTLEALARQNLGMEGGRRYYKFVDDSAKNGLPYFYSVVAYDHDYSGSIPSGVGNFNSPSANFVFTTALSRAQKPGSYDKDRVYAVPNPVTAESMAPWALGPTNYDASGLKVELRNLPMCRSVVRIYTVAGDLVQKIDHDGSGGNGTMAWNLVSRNGQDVVSGVYIFAVEPQDGRFERIIGKFVVIR